MATPTADRLPIGRTERPALLAAAVSAELAAAIFATQGFFVP
jgi:hypothetical protein